MSEENFVDFFRAEIHQLNEKIHLLEINIIKEISRIKLIDAEDIEKRIGKVEQRCQRNENIIARFIGISSGVSIIIGLIISILSVWHGR